MTPKRPKTWPYTGSGSRWPGLPSLIRSVSAAKDRRENYGEERYILLGMVDNRLLHVAYTLRGQRVRIISARLAEPREKRRYHEENR
jgi:uncharacterized DUF497 family protein